MSKVIKGLLKCIVSPICLTIATAGAALLALGFLGKSAIDLFLPTLLGPISSTGLFNATSLQNSIESGSGPFLEGAKYAGGAFAVIGVLGVVAACTGISLLLRLFGLLAILSAGVLLIIAYQFTTGTVETKIKTSLKDTITNEYKNVLSFLEGGVGDVYTMIWTAVMLIFRCCGVDDFSDFNNTLHWNRTLTIYNFSIYQVSPIACCKNNLTVPPFPDLSSISSLTSLPSTLPAFFSGLSPFLGSLPQFFNATFQNPECVERPSEANSNYHMGCWAATTEKIGFIITLLNYIMYFLIATPMALGIIAILASFKPDGKKDEKKKEKSTDCDSALIPLPCVHG